jgi:hypothetical protein
MSAQEEFLKDTEGKKEVDILDQPLVEDEDFEKSKVETKEDDKGTDDEDGEDATTDGKPKNRRERRLMAKLQSERESSMFLAGKLEARTEAAKAVTEESDYIKSLEKIWGTETPEAQIATDLLKKAVVGARDDAEQRAFARLQELQRTEAQEERQADTELDNMIDDIEDTYSVSLTEPQEKAYFQLLVKMSPKDKEGRVSEYADPHAVWEVFQEKLQSKKPDTRAKDLSSRSMVHSGSAKDNKGATDAHEKFLKENGII